MVNFLVDLLIYWIISLFTGGFRPTPEDDRETLSWLIFDETDQEWEENEKNEDPKW